LIIVVNKDADEALIRDIAIAQKEVERLKSKNKYTQRQLQDLNRRFLDSIKVYHQKMSQQESLIERLELAYSESEQQNKSMQDSLEVFKNQLNLLKTRNNLLFSKLGKAMEERYQRQRTIFDSWAKNLRLYVSRSKDVRDHLKSIEPMIKSGQLHYYYKALENYNSIYEDLEGSKDEYQNGIQHYWNSSELSQEFEEIRDFIFEDLHRAEILDLNNTVNGELQKASSGKKIKIKTVKKHAKASIENLDEKLIHLENLVDQHLNTLVIF
jgi:predicted RNase H-like nuclease (RuvC/YqgF family)